ncbi:MAG: LPXTG cell wall anchor domain-containing protein [Acutalibacteraceae bacterium]|nr:LPXTG cell wall anchor domain-containing protein [Acutalibacteraceae bacterium]
MKKKLSVLSALYTAVLLVIASTLNTFAYNTSSVSTGDSTTTLVVMLSVILVAAILAILLLSKKR